MWSFDNNVRDSISEAYKLLENDKIEEFLEKQENVWELTLDIMHKEEEVLFPTSMKMISEEEFKQMRAGDDEIAVDAADNGKNQTGKCPHYPIENHPIGINNRQIKRRQLSQYHCNQCKPQTFA